ncbi:MAG: HAMP domain-containing histidine kinase [Planctomycetes bacterium]|nr:HAMP domain-containing histidine kinase [Planctomycetota bacterium]
MNAGVPPSHGTTGPSLPNRELLEALAEFAAGAGHEINNPVAVIVGRVERLLRDERDPERRHALAAIAAQAYRIRDMIGDAMLFARPPAPAPEPLDLAAHLQALLPALAERAAEMSATLSLKATGPVPILADRAQLSVVVECLVRNAVEAATPGGRILLAASTASEPNGLGGWLIVEDDGRGLSETDRRQLFNPFYSGRQAGRGLGFGLPKCWRIVDAHGGRIEAESQPGRTVFRVWWPQGDGVTG